MAKLVTTVFVAAAGCGSGTPAPSASPSAASVVIRTADDAASAQGKHVRIEGVARREKLGDAVYVGDLAVLCRGVQLPDAMIGTTVTAEGTLNATEYDQPLTNDKGEVSAGPAPGTRRWILDGCTLR
ncbi:MAG TPA: hypothetical protein VFS15_20830 [Kofleriaceae bacterium]|nr:hypothetical protein [Kofleriaceae bacterium]